MTYQGHAGVGRPVPSPQQRPGHHGHHGHGHGHAPPPPRKTPPNVDIRPVVRSPGPDSDVQRDGAGLIAPKKASGDILSIDILFSQMKAEINMREQLKDLSQKDES